MKLRQKLAAVLAATMIVTAMPVMAKSDFALTNGIAVAEKDETITPGGLRIEMKDATNQPFMFFVELDKAEWNISEDASKNKVTFVAGSDTMTVEYTKTNKNEAQVKVTPASGKSAKGEFVLPLNVKVKGGEATVSVDGNGTVVSDMAPVIFATTSEAKSGVTADEATKIYKEGTIADITIEEPRKGTIKDGEEITVTLNHGDYKFTDDAAAVKSKIKLSKGYSTDKTTIDVVSVKDDEIKFKVNGISTQAAGRIELEGLRIKSTEKNPSIGDKITVTVNSSNIDKTKVTVAVATEIGNSIEMEDKKVVAMVAGEKEEVSFKISENVDDSMLAGRGIEVRLEKGFLHNQAIEDVKDEKGNVTETKAKIEEKVKDIIYSAVEVEGKKGTSAITITDLVKDDDDRVIGFEFEVKDGILTTTDTEEIEFNDLEVYMPLGVKGDVKVYAEGRGLGAEINTTLATVKEPVEVTAEAMTLKVGLKDQKGGKIVIKETDKGMIKQGEDLIITIDEKDKGFEFTDVPKIEVKGDLKLDIDAAKVSKDGSYITIPVKRESDEASTITITEIPVKTDRTVPEGKYDLLVSGKALQKDCDFEDIKAEDFIIIGTPNTEDLGSNGLKKVNASFVIDSNKYVVNGVEMEMDGAAYLDAAGRTMVPVRFVANALGVDDTNIYFAARTVTIIAGSKTVSLEIGSKVAKLNGAPARVMDVAPVIKNERAYVPVGEIAALLGVDAKWDGATKTATFINQ